MRLLAEAAATAGFPALRFDYSGTGDSSDVEADVDQIALWTRDVREAALELRRVTGVTRIGLLGVRLGALVAGLAAKDFEAVDALIFIAPIINGERYLRELRVAQMSSQSLSDLVEPTEQVSGNLVAGAASDMEISGFKLSAATRQVLADTDLAPITPVRQLLILDEITVPTAREWNAALETSGVPTTYAILPGLLKMAMTAPHSINVPLPMISAVSDWLKQLATGPSESRAWQSPAMPASKQAGFLVLHGARRHDVSVERPVFIQSHAKLFGIVTEPPAGEGLNRAVILLNQGAFHHIGGSRMHVSFARRWAQRGYLSLRLDLAGLGESTLLAGSPDDEAFPAKALDDIRSAITFLRERYGIVHVSLGGLCSAAYHAVRAAAAGMPVDRILLVNPVNFYWKPGMNLHEVQLAQVVRDPSAYFERIFSWRAIKKLFTGRVDIARILRVYINSLVPVESTLRDLARRLRIRLPLDIGQELEEIAARGVRIVFVFADGDPGIDLLKLEAGASITRLGDRCKIHLITGGDHNFNRSAARSVMEDVLTTELFLGA
jgi:alpha-beta hydrolase superfamily lysophospholipase